MHSYLIVTPRSELIEELRRRQGEDLQMIPLKSVSALDDVEDQHLAAIMIQVPAASASLDLPRLDLPLPTEPQLTLEARVDVMERRIIEDSLERNNHRRKETAAELGISRVTLYNKMKKFNLL